MIDFPKNFQHYIITGLKEKVSGNFEKALDYYKKAFDFNESYTSFSHYFITLVEMELFEEAFDLAEQYPQWTQENETILTAYILTLIKIRDFLKAEALMMRHKQSEKLSKDVTFFLENSLKEERHYSKKEQQKNEKEIIQRGYAIAEAPLIEQMQILKETDKLNFDDQIHTLEVIATNPMTSQLIRSSALLLLSQYDVAQSTGKINFLWFEEKKSICLKEIHSLEENKTIQLLHEKLEERLGENPSLHQIISQELDIQILQLYPYIEDVITLPELWIDFYLNKFDERPIDYSAYPKETAERLKEWFKKLSSIPLL